MRSFELDWSHVWVANKEIKVERNSTKFISALIKMGVRVNPVLNSIVLDRNRLNLDGHTVILSYWVHF